MKTADKAIIGETLSILLNELKEECLQTLKLLSQLETRDLTAEQMSSILSELAVSTVHLNAHTEGIQDKINDEIEQL